jgi:hypothetical protein
MIWLSVYTGTGVGDNRERPETAPQIQRLIALLPRDTETLHVAQSYAMPAPGKDRLKNPPSVDLRRGCQLAAMEGLWQLDHGKYLGPLAGRKVAVALRGSRNVDVASYFGSLRSEGCAVIVLETDLDADGKAWTEMLRTGARQIRKIGGHDVFVFDSTTVMEPSVTPKPWQGTFLVLLTSKVILAATSDKYLEEVLANLDVVPAVRALPDTLPEWKHVDTTAPGWLLRHVPETAPNGHSMESPLPATMIIAESPIWHAQKRSKIPKCLFAIDGSAKFRLKNSSSKLNLNKLMTAQSQ